MKRFLLATVALAALSAPAAAADLATKYPVKAVAVPVFSWTGFYIGANAGYGGDSISYDGLFGAVSLAPFAVATTGSQSSSGFFAGGQIGYNYQFANNVVLGLETDLQWSDISGSSNLSGTVIGLPVSATVGYSTSVDYFGTIRARIGYAFDRFLPYITGGAAYGKVSDDLNAGAIVGPAGAGIAVSDSSTKWGWTIGGGVEYAITNNWTFKTEYLYVDLGNTDVDLSSLAWQIGGTAGDYLLSHDNKFHTFKAGVNYKF